MADPRPTLSIVIPLYRSAATIGRVVSALEALEVEGGIEIVLVNDGSPDETWDVCLRIQRTARVPVVLVDLARNFGEHNAVLAGLRISRGAWVVTMDDDGQNPPAEVSRLLGAAQAGGHGVVFGGYAEKQHAAWRNLGSAFVNKVAEWVLEKPRGLYLSSFRCMSAFLVAEITKYNGPYPYIDGLILQSTRRIGSVTVAHEARDSGASGYTMRKLVRLWMNLFVNFSVLPLRFATFLGLLMGAVGLAGVVIVLALWLQDKGPAFGWGSLMAALLVFSGAQLVVVGLIGEYVGRTYISMNRKPQSVVREVIGRD